MYGTHFNETIGNMRLVNFRRQTGIIEFDQIVVTGWNVRIDLALLNEKITMYNLTWVIRENN
jgi:hypothetical protein